ncbi:hypothetical protein [Zooshikella harenae]|uniref:Uncharacterized protein n=1 Tax=Zooshikella harenae TaxID=2827238 RepID=A0ABS5ZIP0_9GAMM|nr:hypothetical protein [Zooshikella harenae]MBU2713830.1 hypothetical protein [Zooshikella harenae]
MNTENYIKKIKSIDWTMYETAYGNASQIPVELERLISNDQSEALDATHELWCSLCHQHAYVSSASEPAYHFLKAILETSEDPILTELLNIFAGFAECTSPKHPDGNGAFQKRVRELMKEDIELFKSLSAIEGEDGFAEYIVTELTTNI